MMAFLALVAALLLLGGAPLWLVLLVSATSALALYTDVPLAVVPSTLFGALDNFVLLAVPGFVFAGAVMSRGGMTARLVRWLGALVGPVPGGTALTTVGVASLFGAISGSSAAATAALGQILYPALRGHGYPERFSLGLVTAAGALALIIPPSIPMILFSAITGAPLAALFIAGVVPGLVLALLYAAYAVAVHRRAGDEARPSWSRAEILASSREAGWTLGLPVIIFGGIYGGYTTPTEAAVIAALYAVAVAAGRYRELGLHELGSATREATRLVATVFLITACAALFSWVLTVEQVPLRLADAVGGAGLARWTVLLGMLAVLLAAGMIVDPISVVLVMTPILWPVARAIELDALHFGVIMTVSVAIGMFSPPFGINLFVAGSVLGVPAGRLAASVLPFLLLAAAGLLAIAFVPALSLWLPGLMRG